MIFAEVCLLTKNVPELAEFYKTVLKTTSDCNDDIHQAIMTNGAMLTIYNNGEVSDNKNKNMVIAFTVDNVDEEYERLIGLGIKILEPPTTRPWGARNMIFEDPDGNQVVFRCFPD
jgi:predicted enzyme related to lactoylglutathione lyase